MDFKLILEQIKHTDPATFAIVAEFVILFYSLKIVFKFITKGLKVAFYSKEKYEDYLKHKADTEELKKATKELKQIWEEEWSKAGLENKKRDEKTHKLLIEFKEEFDKKINKLEVDLNAYKNRTHALKADRDSMTNLVKENIELIEKMGKIIGKKN